MLPLLRSDRIHTTTGSNWPLPSSRSPSHHRRLIKPQTATVSAFRLIPKSGGAPGHCARPRLGPRPLKGPKEHGAAPPQHHVPQQVGKHALGFGPQDSLPPASNTERAGPFVKVFSTLPTIKGSLAGQLGTPLRPLSDPKLISNMVFHMPSQI